MSVIKTPFYELRPNKLGKLVFGLAQKVSEVQLLSMKKPVTEECKQQVINVSESRLQIIQR